MTDPTPTPEPLRATPEQWQRVINWCKRKDDVEGATIRELLHRVQALEAANQQQGTPAEPAPPAGPDFSNGLRAAVAVAVKDAWHADMTAGQEAAACLRVIAAWLRQRHGGSSTTADLLDAEADRP